MNRFDKKLYNQNQSGRYLENEITTHIALNTFIYEAPHQLILTLLKRLASERYPVRVKVEVIYNGYKMLIL